MRVKHKNSEKGVGVTSMALCHWHEHYLPNKKYLNYEFYDVPDIFDLFEINKETGKDDIYIRTDFKSTLAHLVNENPFKYVLKEVDPNRLDEYLMPKKIDYSGVSFFKRLLIRIKQIIKPKKNPNKIPFNRYESITIKTGILAIIIAIIIPIILFIIDKVFLT